MATATYALEMEFSTGVWTDVWSAVHAGTPIMIRRGISNPLERIADIGSITFKLLNSDHKYSPDHASAQSGFEIGIGVRLRATFSATTYDLFRGTIVDILPTPGLARERRTAVVCYDDMDKLARRKLDKLALQTNKRSDQLVDVVVNNVYTPIAEDYATGQDTYAFAGDTWRDEVTRGRQALADIVRSEWGTLWIGGDGTVIFKDRHHRPKKGAADTTITSGWRDMDVSRAREDIANIVEVTVMPRVVGDAGSVMWTLEGTPSLDPGDSETYTAQYTDPNQEVARVGGQSMTDPVATTDYTMNSQADGGGDDLTADFTVAATFGGNAADLLVTNNGSVAGYITKLQIRGTPLLTYQTILLRAEDTTSQDDYGPLELSMDMPIQDDPAAGRHFTNHLLGQLKDPLTRVRSIGIIANRSDAFMAAALARDVSDKLSITEPETGLSAETFFIESVEHQIAHGGRFHKATWGLSSILRYQMFVLGISLLGAGTRLGY